MTNEELNAIRERAEEIVSDGFQNYEYSPLRYFLCEDVPKLLAEVERLRSVLEEISDINEYASGHVAREALRNE